VAKLKKKSARAKPAAASNGSADLQARAEHLSRSLVESAQQIWMAGVGAFNRAQGEGSKLFEALVKEGMTIDKHARSLAGGRVDAVRDAVEDRVQRALNKLGIPGREEVAGLNARVDALTAQLRRNGAARPAKKAAPAKKPAAKKPAARKAAKSPAKAPAKGRKSASRSLPRAPRPVAPQA
jgi:polyhydroxyalkanoate synthesis regulator phasin